MPSTALPPQHEGKYSDSEPGATYVYASSSFLDDLALAVSGGVGAGRGAGWLVDVHKEQAIGQWLLPVLPEQKAPPASLPLTPSTLRPPSPPQAGWLYRATGEDAYLSAARGYLQRAQVRRGRVWRSVEARRLGHGRAGSAAAVCYSAMPLPACLLPCPCPHVPTPSVPTALAVPAQLLCQLGLGLLRRRRPAAGPGGGPLPGCGPGVAGRRLPRHLA